MGFILKDWHGKEQVFNHDKIFVRDENGELVQFTQGTGDVPAVLQDKTITENGTYTADSGYDGLGSVTVEVAGSGGGGLEAGVYWGFGEAPPQQYYQKWFMYKGELYVMARTAATSGNEFNLYKYVDGKWSTLISNSTLPKALSSPLSWSFVEFNGKIHMLGCESTNHFEFNGTTFTQKNTLPNKIYMHATFVQNNQLKAYSYYDGNIYVWDESTDTWTNEAKIGSKYNYYYAVKFGEDVYFWNSDSLYKYENGVSTKIATLSYSSIKIMIEYKSCLYYYYDLYNTKNNTFWSAWHKYDPATGTDTFLGYGPYSDSNYDIFILQNKLYLQFGSPDAKTNIGVMHEVSE